MAALTPATPQISLQGVGKTYPNGTVALRDVTLEIPKQDFVFLVGPSGAGKSTLVRLLIREEKATAGKIRVEGQDLTGLLTRLGLHPAAGHGAPTWNARNPTAPSWPHLHTG